MNLFTSSCFALVACGVLSLIFYLYAKYKLSYWKRQGIPSLPTHLIFGNFKDALLFRTSPGVQLGQIYKEANDDDPVVGFYILYKPFLLLRDPKVIKQILLKDFNLFPDRYFNSGKSKDKLGKFNLFSIKSPEWKYLRTKLSPAFSSGKIKKFFPLMLQSAENMKNYLNNQIKDGEVKTNFEVRSISSKYIMDIISSFAFGISTDSFQIPEPEFLVRSTESFKTSFLRAFQLFAVFFFPELQSVIETSMLGKQSDYFRTVFWDSMNSREKSGLKRGDVIDNLLEIKNEKQQSDFKFEGDALVSQSAVFSVAGLETSATTTAFTLLELARNIEIQDRVREEIKEKIKENGLTYDSVQEMKYLQQTIAETLRLVPPASILDRVALVDYKIPGTDIVIKKGTVVYTPLHGLHEDPKYYSNPKSYDPDRFSDERKKDIVPCTYMPFGDGPRICIGQRLALLQVAVGLITILKDFEISLNPMYRNEVDPRAIFVLPTNGINLYFSRIPTATLFSSSNH